VLVAEVVLNAYRMWQISGIGGVALWRDVADMRWTRFWLLRCVGVVLFGAVLTLSRGVGVPTAILASGWLGLHALQGHAGAHSAAAAAVDWAHLTAASAWLGALLQFTVAESGSATALRRLRCLATTAVTLLIPSGVYGAVLHVQSVAALLHSSYGRMLLAKLTLALPLLALGAWNHFRLSPRALSGDAAAMGRLRDSVATELALGALVLLASGILGSLPMPHR
jgi:putative copper export protein